MHTFQIIKEKGKVNKFHISNILIGHVDIFRLHASISRDFCDLSYFLNLSSISNIMNASAPLLTTTSFLSTLAF